MLKTTLNVDFDLLYNEIHNQFSWKSKDLIGHRVYDNIADAIQDARASNYVVMDRDGDMVDEHSF